MIHSSTWKNISETENILYHTFSDDMKAAIIERFWRSFQTILYRYLGANHASKYVLDKIVLTYNTRILKIAPSYFEKKSLKFPTFSTKII